MPAAVEQIQNAYSAEPFQPFALDLQDGRKVPVARRHCLQFTATASKIVVTQSNGWVDTISVIDVLAIGAANADTLAAYAQAHPVDQSEWLRSGVSIPGRGLHDWYLVVAPCRRFVDTVCGLFASAPLGATFSQWISRQSVRRRVACPLMSSAGHHVRWRYVPWTSPLKASLELFVLAVFVLLALTFWT
jgi:hypothetical protein